MANLKTLNTVIKVSDVLKDITTAGYKMAIDKKTFGASRTVHVWSDSQERAFVSFDGYHGYFFDYSDLVFLPHAVCEVHKSPISFYETCVTTATDDNEVSAYPITSAKTSDGKELYGLGIDFLKPPICWVDRKLYDRMIKIIRKDIPVRAFYSSETKRVSLFADCILIGFVLCTIYNP